MRNLLLTLLVLFTAVVIPLSVSTVSGAASAIYFTIDEAEYTDTCGQYEIHMDFDTHYIFNAVVKVVIWDTGDPTFREDIYTANHTANDTSHEFTNLSADLFPPVQGKMAYKIYLGENGPTKLGFLTETN